MTTSSIGRPLAYFLGAAVLAFVVSPVPVDAKIRCQGIFQVTKYGLLSTPYCQDQQIARVARSRGWNVSQAQIGKDPLKKVYLCQVLGSDVRLKGACGAYAPENYGF